MKMFLISDNVDTLTGMRLAGIDGVVVHREEEIHAELDKILEKKDVGVLLLTEKIVQLVEKRMIDIKINYQIPLVVQIPDRHGTSTGIDSITRYVSDAIGLKL